MVIQDLQLNRDSALCRLRHVYHHHTLSLKNAYQVCHPKTVYFWTFFRFHAVVTAVSVSAFIL